MKNWEKYEKQIKENGLAHIAVTKNGKMKMCNKECDDCIFNDNENTHCSDSFLDWLYEEATPWLTRQERDICEAFDKTFYFLSDLYIARNKNNELYIYCPKPIKYTTEWDNDDDLSCCEIGIRRELFQFITWEDEKPWSIADLLKLEVEG